MSLEISESSSDDNASTRATDPDDPKDARFWENILQECDGQEDAGSSLPQHLLMGASLMVGSSSGPAPSIPHRPRATRACGSGTWGGGDVVKPVASSRVAPEEPVLAPMSGSGAIFISEMDQMHRGGALFVLSPVKAVLGSSVPAHRTSVRSTANRGLGRRPTRPCPRLGGWVDGV